MNLEQLKNILKEEMSYYQTNGHLDMLMTPGFADKRLYAIHLVETYHYTKHNSKNQAIISTRQDKINPNYAKFCLHHAADEVGHELMALHDIQNMGYDINEELMPEPLPATKTLISYLYYVAHNELPVARLGYSFWAERVYDYIKPLLSLVEIGMGVKKSSMTFFKEHAEIDVKHAKEIDNMIERFVKTDKEWQIVEEVMKTSLKLTISMTDEIIQEFSKIKDGIQTRYSFLGK
jgi:pyrroloquinoline quinone (PQQ) biosynthesis protein C